MKKLAIVLVVVLFGCGGSSFTALEVIDSGQADAVVRDADSASSAPEDGGVDSRTPDTEPADTEPADTAPADTAPAGDGNTCVPISPSTVVLGSLCGSAATSMMFQVPAQMIFEYQQGCLTPFPTPLACQCAETYTCACIGNPTACESPGCTVRDGVVVISCN